MPESILFGLAVACIALNSLWRLIQIVTWFSSEWARWRESGHGVRHSNR